MVGLYAKLRVLVLHYDIVLVPALASSGNMARDGIVCIRRFTLCTIVIVYDVHSTSDSYIGRTSYMYNLRFVGD